MSDTVVMNLLQICMSVSFFCGGGGKSCRIKITDNFASCCLQKICDLLCAHFQKKPKKKKAPAESSDAALKDGEEGSQKKVWLSHDAG